MHDACKRMMQLVAAVQREGPAMLVHLEQQRDAVGEPVHVEAGLEIAPAQADGRLHDERVALQHAHIPCARPPPHPTADCAQLHLTQ